MSQMNGCYHRLITGLFQGDASHIFKQLPPISAPKKKRAKDKYVQMCEFEQKKMNTFRPCATAFFVRVKTRSRDVFIDETCGMNAFMS